MNSKNLKKAVDSSKETLNKVNEFALKTTERTITETFSIISQWQNVTDKALKGSIKLIDNQQNIVFDALESYKKHFVKGSKRLQKVFS